MKTKAFTLIEVLVALIILAIAFIAIIRTTESNISSAEHIKNINAASWVAENALSQAKLGIDKKSGSENILHETWQWKLSTKSTAEQAASTRVAIDVFKKNKHYYHLTGFIRHEK